MCKSEKKRKKYDDLRIIALPRDSIHCLLTYLLFKLSRHFYQKTSCAKAHGSHQEESSLGQGRTAAPTVISHQKRTSICHPRVRWASLVESFYWWRSIWAGLFAAEWAVLGHCAGKLTAFLPLADLKLPPQLSQTLAFWRWTREREGHFTKLTLAPPPTCSFCMKYWGSALKSSLPCTKDLGNDSIVTSSNEPSNEPSAFRCGLWGGANK